MIDIHAQIHREIQQIIVAVSEMTGLSSRWSGIVELVPNADFKGKKRWSCDIQLLELLAWKEERWSTLIHEVLHSMSAGYNFSDFQAFKGWEEGMVEQLQRLLRPAVLAKLGVSVAPDTFESNDKYHAFNRFIKHLEHLRVALHIEEDEQAAFYIALLGVPIRDRGGYVLDRARQVDGVFRMEFVKVFAAANAALIGGTGQ